ncbi:Uncharacterised protein [uncultured Roseburia sp.]|nr:Uncharacterised protein [uncultured Roseburia sp.]
MMQTCKYQDRVTFIGGYDNQFVFDHPRVTKEEIQAEVYRTMELLAPGGSFIVFPLSMNFEIVPAFIEEHMKHAICLWRNRQLNRRYQNCNSDKK